MAGKSSRVRNKEKMFRDFLVKKHIRPNPLKHYRKIVSSTAKRNGLNVPKLQFMFWAYDLEFFTIWHATEDNNYNYRHVEERLVYPLVNDGWLYKYYDKLAPSQLIDRQVFDENKYNYRVRYALTQKGRTLINSIYDKLNF